MRGLALKLVNEKIRKEVISVEDVYHDQSNSEYKFTVKGGNSGIKLRVRTFARTGPRQVKEFTNRLEISGYDDFTTLYELLEQKGFPLPRILDSGTIAYERDIYEYQILEVIQGTALRKSILDHKDPDAGSVHLMLEHAAEVSAAMHAITRPVYGKITGQEDFNYTDELMQSIDTLFAMLCKKNDEFDFNRGGIEDYIRKQKSRWSAPDTFVLSPESLPFGVLGRDSKVYITRLENILFRDLRYVLAQTELLFTSQGKEAVFKTFMMHYTRRNPRAAAYDDVRAIYLLYSHFITMQKAYSAMPDQEADKAAIARCEKSIMELLSISQ
ncbi:MAG: hypothetical protein ACOCXT_05130 [Candidatus Dojkabacteria bacterium]